MTDVEQLLRSALAPVEPEGGFSERLESKLEELEARLTELTDDAAGELGDWEAGAMRDPRNWHRPVAAAAVVGLAGGALVVVRARQQHRKRDANGLRALERGARDVGNLVRRRLERG
jgi:hypothetical protein